MNNQARMTKTLESKISQGDPEGVEIDWFNLDEERKRKKIFVVIQNKTDQAPKNLDKSLNLEKKWQKWIQTSDSASFL